MKLKKQLVLLLSMIPGGIFAQALKQPADYVNVFTGSSNSRWADFPGAALPFGMVKLSPDNQDNVWNGGYEYTVGSISGFSHIHAMSLGGVSVMPVVGKMELYPRQVKTFPGQLDGPFGTMWTAGYRSRYTKSTEKASAGYYSVFLQDYGIKAELTATTRTGWLQFTFPETDEAHILFDFDFPMEEKTEIKEVEVHKTSQTRIEGFIRQKNDYADDYTVYFVSEFSKPFDDISAWQAETTPNRTANYGYQWRTKQVISKDIVDFKGKQDCGIFLNFKTKKDEVVLVRTGISFVSTAQAQLNLTTEARPFGWDFKAVAATARNTWNDLLSTVEITATEPEKELFYTNLYRAYSGRAIMSDADHQYTDPCEKIQQAKGEVFSSDGFWGTQWNLTPLWTLLTPDKASAWVNSFLEIYDKGGWLPEAPDGIEYAPIMGSQHHKALIVSSYQKGIRTFDVNKAWTAIKHDLTTPGQPHPCGGYAGNRQLAPYLQYGFVPDEAGAASNTLEYAYDDYCAAQLAKALHKEEDYRYFTKRSQNYKNLFDSNTKFMRRRHTDGTFVSPFDPHYFGTTGGWNGSGFMEGTAWIYSFFVPQDVPALVQLVGKEAFNQRLEEGFAKGYVDLGNQPNLQAPFLFNYSGKPWLTQQYSRQVAETLFNTSPYSGWVGEEDEGQMGAFFVLLSMGLFEMDGGCAVKPYYDLSSPLYEKIVLHLDKHYYPGSTFTIEARNNSAENKYIQSATLNGKILNKPMIYHEDLIKGGTLVLMMGKEPNKNWGIKD